MFFFHISIVLVQVIGEKYVLKLIVDDLMSGQLTFATGLFCTIFLSIAPCGTAIGAVLITKAIFNLTTRVKMDIKNAIFQYISKHPVSFFTNNFAGALNSKINSISNGVEDMVMSLAETFSIIICFLCLMAIFSTKSMVIFGFCVVWFVICSGGFVVLFKKIKKASGEKSNAESECSGKMIDCLTNIVNIKSFSREKYEKSSIKKANIEVAKKDLHLILLRNLLDVFNFIFVFVLLFGVLITSLKLVLKGVLTAGDLVFSFLTTRQLAWYARYILRSLSDNSEYCGEIQRALDTLVVSHNIKNLSNKPISITTGNISIDNICFRYGPELPLVFENFSLTVPARQKIGIVGYSGSGKSTLINLLLRFYDVDAGGIYIDGQNIKTDVTQESLRHNISYIPQDPLLFHRTIGENIRYGKPNCSEEELIDVAKRACCYDFIMSMKDKFDTLVGERGAELSGGQRQRVSIARAILKNSRILILDEATAALDSVTEREIQKALNNLMQNKTVIVIAHRLSTLGIMDRIVVMDKGRIVEDGTKDELLNSDGLFRKIWNMQVGGIVGV
ncbi:MAG: ABC transporter ATP-binding protein/permease [Rickettsiales bacterium]|jgi:ATP-binding cassette subfamily B protein|nr:ABC transporter ATP-binding protein/permease [Rickettsiales bacterium]